MKVSLESRDYVLWCKADVMSRTANIINKKDTKGRSSSPRANMKNANAPMAFSVACPTMSFPVTKAPSTDVSPKQLGGLRVN